jgi:hypothetical protein
MTETEIIKGFPENIYDNDIQKKDNAETYFLVASSCRGKSYIIKEMYDKMFKKIKDLIIIMISPSMNISLFKDIKGPNVIKINKFNKDTNTLLKKIVKLQGDTDNMFRFLIIIDDCIEESYNQVVNNLFLVNRNQQITTILSCQYPAILSKRARGSCKNIICGGINSDESIKVLTDSFLKSEMINKYFPNEKKISEIDIINKYRGITDGNNGHVFFYHNPQQRILQPFTL